MNDLSNRNSMEIIARGDIDKYIIEDGANAINNTKMRLRLFLLAQASRELEKVIKLSDTIEKLQDIYQDKAMEYISRHNSPEEVVQYLPYMIDTIAKCLERSNNIIKQVAGDEKLMSLINIDLSTVTNNIINTDKETASNAITHTLNSVSRDKVREAINIITAEIKSIEDENKEGSNMTVEPKD